MINSLFDFQTLIVKQLELGSLWKLEIASYCIMLFTNLKVCLK